jgi:hypothetical protein
MCGWPSPTEFYCLIDPFDDRAGESVNNQLHASMEQSSLRSQQFLLLSKNCPYIMELGGSSHFSEKNAASPYPEPYQANPNSRTLFLYDTF